MKKIAPILLVIILLSCSNDSDDKPVDLLGKWKLIEQLADPGDGSGVFINVSSNKTVEFLENATVLSNGTLCHMSTETGTEGTGTFSSVEDALTIEGVILPDACEFSEAKIFYRMEGNKLILSYLCFEGCGQRFTKIN